MNTACSARRIGRFKKVVGLSVAVMCTAVFGVAPVSAEASPAWRVMGAQYVPDPSGDNLLFGLSCPLAGSCVAVGYSGDSGLQGTLVETLTGGKWRVSPSPMAGSPFVVDSLNAVSCPSADSCAAVGSASNMTGTSAHTLVETLGKGTWQVSPSPNTAAALNTLSGVSCPSSRACEAVGYDGTPSLQNTLVESLRNGTWRTTPSPDANSPYVVNFFNAISCTSATHCVAVGFAADATGMESRTLIETLTGGKWRMTPSPNTRSPINELFGARCTTATLCVAVGDYGSISSQRTLVETLTSGRWSITPSPNTTWPINQLFYAWCASKGSCAAAGFAMNSTATEARTLIETFSGSSWVITATPNTASPLNELYGYSCPSPDACYAVGARGTDSAQTALIEAT